jgi:hypothetical protein
VINSALWLSGQPEAAVDHRVRESGAAVCAKMDTQHN